MISLKDLPEPNALQPGGVALLGIPWDEQSSFLKGCAGAPRRIREVLASGASNLCAENGIDLAARADFYDAGDLALTSAGATADGDQIEALAQIEKGITALAEKKLRPLCLGGDHAVTYPVVKALAAQSPGFSILHLDAHPDLYDAYEGNRYSHACPFARILEDGYAARLVQVGIRTLNPHQRAQAARFGVEIYEMRHWKAGMALPKMGTCYLSVDLDVLDPAFAPGVSHHEPGGMTVRDVLGIIHELDGELVGADIVEYNPQRDLSGVTGAAACKILKEIAARMFEST